MRESFRHIITFFQKGFWEIHAITIEERERERMKSHSDREKRIKHTVFTEMHADCTHIYTHKGQSQGNATKKITNGEINSS